MKYVNADEVFPKELVIEMQKYAQGQIVYISKLEGNHKKWGEKSGNRQYLKQRNQAIQEEFQSGASIVELSDRYFLSVYSIKKIVYTKIQS
ncbi:CD3324 family protein [Chengkuizengella axinellae]|uniref:CD3324 family protein n=1 Tax=Chengkuizengella axinellae TaxID=3064388 RepID=A0ABT9J390_9BACL|nr:CD3324 family protein [Chengkuizengella sp. 2205SS18-9]MDP5276033.1 CD3324 family protein [Chengkuizengella sp. 2205SS18-9]